MLRIQLSVTNSGFLLILLFATLLLVLLLPELAGNEGIKLGIGNLLLTLEATSKGEFARKDNGASGQNGNGGLEMSDELTSLLSKNGVGSEKIVIKALLDTNLCTNGVLEGTDGEGKSGEALVDLSEESTRLLELQVVLSIELAFVDGCAEFALFGLALTSRDVDIESNDVTWGELELFNALVSSLLVYDDIVAVDEVLLELVREDSLNSVNSELFTDLGNSLGHLVVSGLFANNSLSGEH